MDGVPQAGAGSEAVKEVEYVKGQHDAKFYRMEKCPGCKQLFWQPHLLLTHLWEAHLGNPTWVIPPGITFEEVQAYYAKCQADLLGVKP